MQIDAFEIKEYSDQYREQLLDVWEKSVVATHHFLTPKDFQSIKALVQTINFNEFQVYCLIWESEVAGIIGVLADKMEMLFIAPDFMGQGLGRRLMEFAIDTLKISKVDVNEQNTKSVSFYKKLGFEVYERTDQDDQGNEYPLLRMKLIKTN
ncbi:MAG: GNAT family N-acetyltransferase [Saprospiraceae bacterium]|nr:GNAT family N-acetyltransferase [Saprospiraceae bacterium]